MSPLRDVLAADLYAVVRQHSYLALDVPTWEEAEAIVTDFGEVVTGYKLGLELFHGAGQRAVEQLVRLGKRVFLDVKLHDIPNTVAGALRVLRDSGVELVNVHALGGPRMLEAARDALAGAGQRPRLIAVTVLTSLGDEALAGMGLPTATEMVPRLARLAYDHGLDGVVASAQDVRSIYTVTPTDFLTVVPGTRLAGGDAHDQVRTMTPAEAMAAGATDIVIGRAVTRAEDRWAALKVVWDDMRQGIAERSPR